MRRGRKSGSQRFDGYKIHAAASSTPEPLITAIEITPGREQDGPEASALVDQQPERRRPERLIGDMPMGWAPVRGQLAAREVEVLAQLPEAPVPEGRLATRDFRIDPDAGTVT